MLCGIVECFKLSFNKVFFFVPKHIHQIICHCGSVLLSGYLPEHMNNRVFSKQGIKLLLLGSILKIVQSHPYGKRRPLYSFCAD